MRNQRVREDSHKLSVEKREARAKTPIKIEQLEDPEPQTKPKSMVKLVFWVIFTVL
jgi:hypothetical protein